jgi:hypothetical protein
MPPLALAVVDAVFGLALHHEGRGRRATLDGYERAHVHARLAGPLDTDPVGALELEVVVVYVPASSERERVEHRIALTIDLAEARILAPSLSLAELPLDRSGLARLIGELETWCYGLI